MMIHDCLGITIGDPRHRIGCLGRFSEVSQYPVLRILDTGYRIQGYRKTGYRIAYRIQD